MVRCVTARERESGDAEEVLGARRKREKELMTVREKGKIAGR